VDESELIVKNNLIVVTGIQCRQQLSNKIIQLQLISKTSHW